MTSLGFSAGDFASEVLGVRLLPWQRWLLIHALELRPNGWFRFRIILVLAARQNAKTTAMEIKNLWKLFVLRVLLVIGTAQTLEYAEESWDKAVEIVESIPDLAVEIVHVDKTNGKKTLKLAGGPRWKIAAATRRGGRSLTGDDVNLDELREHQNWDSWAAVTKTTMARPKAQIWAFSNAGDDLSVVLNDLQEKGRAAAADPGNVDPLIGIFEWSVPDDVQCTCARVAGGHFEDCQLQDRQLWAMANPALGYTITEEALATALASDPEAVFRTECLCQRVQSMMPRWQVITEGQWKAAEDPTGQLADPVAVAVDITPDRAWAAVAVAGARAGGGRLIGVVDHRPGVGGVLPVLLGIEERHPLVVIVNDGKLADDCERAGLTVHRPTAADMVTACTALYDGVAGAVEETRDVHHLGQVELTAAVAGAAKRTVGGSWAWDRRVLSTDICPLVAGSLALWGHGTPRVHRPAPRAPMVAALDL